MKPNNTHLGIYILIAVLLVMPVTGSAKTVFSSQQEFTQWLTLYYNKPEPHKVADAVRYMSDSGMFIDRNVFAPLFGFLAGVMRDNPDMIEDWALELDTMPLDHYEVVILGIWYADIPNSSKIVIKILDTSHDLKQRFTYLINDGPMSTLTIPLDQGTWVLDALWGEFSATGKPEPLYRIAEALPWADQKKDPGKAVVGNAANWSLLNKAVHHDKVFRIVKQIAKDQPKNSYIHRVINMVQETRDR